MDIERRKYAGRSLRVVGMLFFLAVANPLRGQILQTVSPIPTFEVASIKPWKARPQVIGGTAPIRIDSVRRSQHEQTDHVHRIGQIALLIMDAYQLPLGSEKRILKAPAWVFSESDRYEVQAKIDPLQFAAMQKMTPAQQREQVALMEQALLMDRFHLKLHLETRGETEVYALVVAKDGPRLVAAKGEDSVMVAPHRNEIRAHAVTLEQFASSPLWTPIGNRPVVNKTGITGTFDFTLRWRSDAGDESESEPGASDLPPLFDAIREQLGLRVVDAKIPLQVLVIDRVDRPTAN